MTFPATSLDLVVELWIDGAWVDITADVYVRDGVVITRGKQDESGLTQPSTLNLTVNNRLGKYSPRNPLGLFYGKIGRNTLIRVTAEGFERFYGEVSAWPARWDVSGEDAYVPLEAAGILRRIGQGSQPVTSALKDYLLSSSPITYWPLDDGEGSTSGADAAGTFRGYRFQPWNTIAYSFGTGTLETYLSPTMRLNDLGSGFFYGYCIGTTVAPTSLAWEFLYRTDPMITGDGSRMAAWAVEPRVIGSTGSKDIWRVKFRRDGTNNDLQLLVTLDSEGEVPTTVDLADTAALTEVTDGELHHVRLQLTQNGADTDYVVYLDGVSVISGTRTSHTLRYSYSVNVVYDRLAGPPIDDLMAIGHLIVWEGANIPPIATTSGLAFGFAGETAGARFLRLCIAADVPRVLSGAAADSMPMGLQYEDYFSNQLTEIEATDRGLMYEARAQFALVYRTRASLYNQTVDATVDYSAGELAHPFEPIEDDQTIRNDVFAQRREGSSYQATLSTGALSIQDPPDGVGRYKDEVQVNVQTDAMLPAMAGWLLHLGTVDEARYPRVTVDLSRLFGSNETLGFTLAGCDVGSHLVLTGAAGIGIYDDVSLLVLGYTETLAPYEWHVTYNCTPNSPYEVIELDDAESRVDPGEESELDGGVTSTATTLSVDASTGGYLWTTAAGDMPLSIMVGGEEMTVTAIAAPSLGVQAFTVTRSVNGVVKAHSNGDPVRLKRPGVVAL